MTSYKEKEVESSDVQEEPVKRKRGRPRKSELIPTKRGKEADLKATTLR
jgi:hypothetical protein